MPKNTVRGSITIDKEACKGCYLCITVCPSKVIFVSKKLNQQGYYPIEFKENKENGKRCSACSGCAIICPDIAIEVFRE